MTLDLSQLRAEITDNPTRLSALVVVDDSGVPTSKTLAELLELGADASVADALNIVGERKRDVLAVLTVPGILSLLSEASRYNLSINPNAPAIRNDLLEQNRTAI